MPDPVRTAHCVQFCCVPMQPFRVLWIDRPQGNRPIGSRGIALARLYVRRSRRCAPSVDGMAMDTGLYRVQTTGLSGLAGIIGSYSAAPPKTAAKPFPSKLNHPPA